MDIKCFDNFVLEDITVGDLISFLSKYDTDTKISFNDHSFLHVSVNSETDAGIECYVANPEGTIPNYENNDRWQRMEDMRNPPITMFNSRIDSFISRFGKNVSVKCNGKDRIKIYYNGSAIIFTS